MLETTGEKRWIMGLCGYLGNYFSKGGYAYLAFGVDQKSDKKFIVNIN